MRIGLYGMPTAGKTHILDRIDFMEILVGSKLLREYDPDFDKQPESVREKDRKEVAKIMLSKEEFIMDGHYAFGDSIAFTEEEGNMYEIYLYLYIDPAVLKQRITNSPKNQKYSKFDVEEWQNLEIEGLRQYCHKHNKDFYVIDNPPNNTFSDVAQIIDFIRDIKNGYSCVGFAKKCADSIIKSVNSNSVFLLDGDKTITCEDTSSTILGYKTNLYDGNFYTGYQAWRQEKEFENYSCPNLNKIDIRFQQHILESIKTPAYILTSGNKEIWEYISRLLNIPFFNGVEMSAETKLYITKFLQAAGLNVIAFGDGMNDYYMLKQADKGFLKTKPNGEVSRSLTGKDLEGLILV